MAAALLDPILEFFLRVVEEKVHVSALRVDDAARRPRFFFFRRLGQPLFRIAAAHEIDRIESAGRQVLFDVDVKGGLNLKRILGDKATSIFICPPSIEELRRRLVGRGDTSPEMIEKRLAKAELELSYKPQFDRVVINDELQHAFEQLDAIIDENRDLRR